MAEKSEIRELAAQDAAIEHAGTDAAGIGAVVDRAFRALFEALERQGVAPGQTGATPPPNRGEMKCLGFIVVFYTC